VRVVRLGAHPLLLLLSLRSKRSFGSELQQLRLLCACPRRGTKSSLPAFTDLHVAFRPWSCPEIAAPKPYSLSAIGETDVEETIVATDVHTQHRDSSVVHRRANWDSMYLH